MNHPKISQDTNAWIFQVWASFILSLAAVFLGIYFIPVEPWIRGYMALSSLFAIGSCFTLAKTIRDNHEASRLIHRVTEAKAEKVLREFDDDLA